MTSLTLSDSIVIAASPEEVYDLVSDVTRTGEWSPQCKKMIIRGGKVDLDTKTININRRGPLVWPTTAKVVRFEPNKRIGWRVTENRTVWSYEITPAEKGVTVTERREAPGGKTSTVSAVSPLAYW